MALGHPSPVVGQDLAFFMRVFRRLLTRCVGGETGQENWLFPWPLFHRQGSSWQDAVVGTGPGSKPVWPVVERRLDASDGYPIYLFAGSSKARAGASSFLGSVAGGVWLYWPRWHAAIPSLWGWRVVGSRKCLALKPMWCVEPHPTPVQLPRATCCARDLWVLLKGQLSHSRAVRVVRLKYSEKGTRCFAVT